MDLIESICIALEQDGWEPVEGTDDMWQCATRGGQPTTMREAIGATLDRRVSMLMRQRSATRKKSR